MHVVIHGAPNPIELTNPILLILLMQILIVFFSKRMFQAKKILNPIQRLPIINLTQKLRQPTH